MTLWQCTPLKQRNDYVGNILIINVLLASNVCMGFILILLTMSKNWCKCPAAARVGINPTPTLAEWCNHLDNPLIAKALHTSAVWTGFIPVLPTADKIKSKCTAAAMVGINPSTTITECCNHFDSPLITKALHTSAVGTGFIPVLLTAGKNWCKYPAAARVGINPTPTFDVCCNHFLWCQASLWLFSLSYEPL